MRNNTYYFKMADLVFSLELPEHKRVEQLLPSLGPFSCKGDDSDEILFHLQVLEIEQWVNQGNLIAESNNDLGKLRLFKQKYLYLLDICSHFGTCNHSMRVDENFRQAEAHVDWTDSYAGEVLNAMIRMIFSQAVIREKGVSLHASAVVVDNRAYLFMGKSGTGKSTHARLWLDAFNNSRLLNDDNPVIRVFNDKILVYGTAWSGKTPCYRNESYPLGGVVRLFQSPFNRFSRVEELDALVMILPGCSVIHKDVQLNDKLCDTLVELTARVPLGKLECLPDIAAVELCMREITKVSKDINE